jgi:hypothetical protein
MFLDVLARFVVLHGGTPVAVSQTTLTLMLVVLGVVAIGIGFGYLTKTKESLLQHRWTLTVAVVLALGGCFPCDAAFCFHLLH